LYYQPVEQDLEAETELKNANTFGAAKLATKLRASFRDMAIDALLSN
jgi:hypothetical protein